MRASSAAVTWLGALLVVAGLAWLAPLMLDQLVLFGDRDQVARAAASRPVMVWPALMVAAGASCLVAARRPMQGAAAALPLVGVLLAWTVPETGGQLVVYGLTVPVALGGVLGAAIPLRRALPLPVVLAATGVLAALVVLAASILTALAVMALAAWWMLSDRAGVRGTQRR